VEIPEKHYQLVSTGKNKYIPTDISTVTSKKKYDNDFLLEELSDLTNDNFRAWYCSKFYKLGKDRVLELASIARADGKNPSRYFSYLLSKK
jgi:membrane-bound lytic murein transglycosylase MltF